MLNEAVEYIRREVRGFLGVDDAEVISGNVHILKDSTNGRGVYLSVVNFEEESTLKNTSHYIRQNGTVHYKQPPVHLNLYLLFAFDFEDYGASLLRLSQTVELFQSKPVHSSANQTVANPFPATLEKLIFDFYNMNFEQLNHLWSILSGTYLPAVLYKVRLIKVQRDESLAGPEITTIQVDVNQQ